MARSQASGRSSFLLRNCKPDQDHRELEALDSGRDSVSIWGKAGVHRALNLRAHQKLLFLVLRTELRAWRVLSMCSPHELPLASPPFPLNLHFPISLLTTLKD